MPATYRSDIDGLRGVSVLSVVLYHARVPGFEGGYVGVDVFFVISGFLITSILLHRSGQDFDLVLFYERRIRRLFPALFTVLFCTLALSVFVLLPDELDRFGQSLISTSVFVPNMFFWRQSGYFAPISENAPLLHLWSLGVEEQFYLLYPAAIIAIIRLAKRSAVIVVAILAFLSFMLCLWGVENHPNATFYLAPTRAWELLLGALISMRALPIIQHRTWNEVSTAVGVVLIGWSVVNLSAESAFPGFNATIPCLGAAMLIHSGAAQKTVVTKALSFRPVVFVGLVSYSLYLWHWPMLALTRRYVVRSLDTVEIATVVTLAFLISVLSWRFVEQPFRKASGVWPRRMLFKVSTGVVVVAVTCGSTLSVMDGFPQRVTAAVRLYEQGSEDINKDRERCHNISPEQIRGGRLCQLGDQSARGPDFIVWGDSHADAMMPAFDALARRHKQYGLFASYTSCPPLLGETVKGGGVVKNCPDFNDAMLEIVNRHHSAAVILVAYWKNYSTGEMLLADATRASKENETPFARGLGRTLIAISNSNRKVWLVQQIPTANKDVPSSLAMAQRRGMDKDFLRPSVESHNSMVADINQVLAHLRQNHSITVVNPGDFLCDKYRCDVESEGRSLYRDSHHLSAYGARHIQPALEEIFTDMQTAQ